MDGSPDEVDSSAEALQAWPHPCDTMHVQPLTPQGWLRHVSLIHIVALKGGDSVCKCCYRQTCLLVTAHAHASGISWPEKVSLQVLQRYHQVHIPAPGSELEFWPGPDLQPMHYTRCLSILLDLVHRC